MSGSSPLHISAPQHKQRLPGPLQKTHHHAACFYSHVCVLAGQEFRCISVRVFPGLTLLFMCNRIVTLGFVWVVGLRESILKYNSACLRLLQGFRYWPSLFRQHVACRHLIFDSAPSAALIEWARGLFFRATAKQGTPCGQTAKAGHVYVVPDFNVQTYQAHAGSRGLSHGH